MPRDSAYLSDCRSNMSGNQLICSCELGVVFQNAWPSNESGSGLYRADIMNLYPSLRVSLRSNKSEIAHTIVKFDTKQFKISYYTKSCAGYR